MESLIAEFAAENTPPSEWDTEGLHTAVLRQCGFDYRNEGINADELASKELTDKLIEVAHAKYADKEQAIGPESMRFHERMLMLQIVDTHWKDHLLAMDHLKEGIGMRAYGQRDPLVEYKRESFALFEDLMNRIEEDSTRFLFLLQPVDQTKQAEQLERRRRRQQFVTSNQGGEARSKEPVKRGTPKVGRNDPCPCGSGKKYKKCCGVAG
jgi:preprotein translocase subunit SecA